MQNSLVDIGEGQVTIQGLDTEAKWNKLIMHPERRDCLKQNIRGLIAAKGLKMAGLGEVIGCGQTSLARASFGYGILFRDGVLLGKYFRVTPIALLTEDLTRHL